MAWKFRSLNRSEDMVTELQAIDMTGPTFNVVDRASRTYLVNILQNLPPGTGVEVYVSNFDNKQMNVGLRRVRLGTFATE